GLAPSGGETQAFSFKSVETIVWLVSLSMIFIIVTSVGALCLQQAVHEFQILAGARVDDPDRTDRALGLTGGQTQRLQQLRDRATLFGLVLDEENGGSHDTNEQFRERKKRIIHTVNQFNSAYTAGLLDYQNAFFGIMNVVRAQRVEKLQDKLDSVM